MGRRTRIFLSYAHRDSATLAERLVGDLESRGLVVWLDQRRLVGGATWTKEIESAIDDADVVLALLSSGSYVSEICRAEQLRSLRKGKCVIPLLAQEGADIPLHLEPRHYLDFSAAAAYTDHLARLLTDIATRTGTVLTPESKYWRTYVTAPPMPPYYVPRPNAVERLRELLFETGANQPIALTAVHGMGGIGKSVLAQALCCDDVVQQAFPDGVIWVTIGKEPAYDLLTRMREVGKALNDDLSRYDSELGCRNQYRTALRIRAALIILDDVWNVREVEPFLADSPCSRLLLTTRDASIAAVLGAGKFSADLLTYHQSREVLARSSGRSSPELPYEADAVIQECGRLPLALSMIGASLRDKPSGFWNVVLYLLRNADLDKIPAQSLNYPHSTLFRAIQVSVDLLDSLERERYVALAVLLEDISAHPAVLRVLWNTNEFETLRTAEQLIGLSLAQRDVDTGAVRLHDLQMDYVRANSPVRTVLPLIHAAVRLSAHVTTKEPNQFAGQITGRLLTYRDRPGIQAFLRSIGERALRPWLRPLRSGLATPGGALVRTLEGHSASVNDVSVSRDGRWGVSASDDYTVRVWDLDNGRELHMFEEHAGPVNAVKLSLNERVAVSASSDGTLVVWDLEACSPAMTLTAHSGWRTGLSATADQGRAISALGEGSLHEWVPEPEEEPQGGDANWTENDGVEIHYDQESDEREESRSEEEDFAFFVESINDGLPDDQPDPTSESRSQTWDTDFEQLRTVGSDSDEVFGLAVSSADHLLIAAMGDGTVRVWDLRTRTELHTLEGHAGRVNSVALRDDARCAVSASCDKTLKVWDLKANRLLKTLEGHSAWVNNVAFGRDSMTLLSASSDGTLKLWDLQTGLTVETFEGHIGAVHCVAVTPNGRTAVSGGADGLLKVWDLETGLMIDSLEGHSGRVLSVALSGDGRRVVSASDDGTLRVWDWASSTVDGKAARHAGFVLDIATNRPGRLAVSASWDRTLKVWDVEAGEVRWTLSGHSDRVTSIALAGVSRGVSASLDGTLKVWDVENGHEVHTLRGHSSGVIGIAMSGSGSLVASISLDRTAKIWDVDRGLMLQTLPCWPGRFRGVAMSADGRRAIFASSNSTLKVLDVQSGKEVRSLAGNFGDVIALAMSADGRRALSVSTDDTIEVWDIRQGSVVLTLRGHSDSVWSVAMSPDGQTGVSASLDRTVRAWDLNTGTTLAAFTCDASALCCHFYGPALVVAGDSLGRVYFFRLEQLSQPTSSSV